MSAAEIQAIAVIDARLSVLRERLSRLSEKCIAKGVWQDSGHAAKDSQEAMDIQREVDMLSQQIMEMNTQAPCVPPWSTLQAPEAGGAELPPGPSTLLRTATSAAQRATPAYARIVGMVAEANALLGEPVRTTPVVNGGSATWLPDDVGWLPGIGKFNVLESDFDGDVLVYGVDDWHFGSGGGGEAKRCRILSGDDLDAAIHISLTDHHQTANERIRAAEAEHEQMQKLVKLGNEERQINKSLRAQGRKPKRRPTPRHATGKPWSVASLGDAFRDITARILGKKKKSP
jgi:hypothetical protein